MTFRFVLAAVLAGVVTARRTEDASIFKPQVALDHNMNTAKTVLEEVVSCEESSTWCPLVGPLGCHVRAVESGRGGYVEDVGDGCRADEERCRKCCQPGVDVSGLDGDWPCEPKGVVRDHAHAVSIRSPLASSASPAQMPIATMSAFPTPMPPATASMPTLATSLAPVAVLEAEDEVQHFDNIDVNSSSAASTELSPGEVQNRDSPDTLIESTDFCEGNEIWCALVRGDQLGQHVMGCHARSVESGKFGYIEEVGDGCRTDKIRCRQCCQQGDDVSGRGGDWPCEPKAVALEHEHALPT